MALIPLKARTGIAALTFAAAVAPFVLTTPAKAITIGFLDASDSVRVQETEDGVPVTPFFQGRESIVTNTITRFPSRVTPGVGGIRFVEPGTDITSDILRVRITATFPLTRLTFFTFRSDPALGGIDTTGFTVVQETGLLQEVGLAPNLAMGIPDSQFRNAAGAVVSLPFDIRVFVQSDRQVPGPLVGAGLPGLVAACGGLLAWWRRRQKIA